MQLYIFQKLYLLCRKCCFFFFVIICSHLTQGELKHLYYDEFTLYEVAKIFKDELRKYHKIK